MASCGRQIRLFRRACAWARSASAPAGAAMDFPWSTAGLRQPSSATIGNAHHPWQGRRSPAAWSPLAPPYLRKPGSVAMPYRAGRTTPARVQQSAVSVRWNWQNRCGCFRHDQSRALASIRRLVAETDETAANAPIAWTLSPMTPAGPEISINRIGGDGQPVVVIDNFFPDAEMLRAVAQTSSFGPARNLYPGIRAPLPDGYWSRTQVRLCETIIARAFDLKGAMTIIDSSFSMVTTPRDQLSVGQRLPHADAFNPQQIALVHYLVDDFTEGTAFYRHRSTGLQAITQDTRRTYFQTLEDELHRLGPPGCSYIRGDTQLFDQIMEVESKFNRAVLYRGQQLHSGAIGPHTRLSSDPVKGRLTVTAFMTVNRIKAGD